MLDRSVLTIGKNRSIARRKCRRGEDLPVLAGGTSCDEYPFASSRQGGAGGTVAKVPLTSNLRQGGVLRSFYFGCLISPDPTGLTNLGKFLVLPVSEAGKSFDCRIF